MDQEKGPSTPLQKSPYHSAMIPGAILSAEISPDKDAATIGPRLAALVAEKVTVRVSESAGAAG